MSFDDTTYNFLDLTIKGRDENLEHSQVKGETVTNSAEAF
jgi:predicted dithiol-disulfide oxidoreductase (DUF899 family)